MHENQKDLCIYLIKVSDQEKRDQSKPIQK